MNRIAITGSSGLIGAALRERLSTDRREVVRAFRGNESDPSALWNPEKGWVKPGAFADCDAIVHLAGASVGEGRWSEARKRELVSSRVDSTRVLIDHLASLPQRPKVFVTASGAGFYGDRGDELLTEESAKGTGFLSDLVEGWERETSRAAEFGMRVVQLRFGVILAKQGGALKKLLLPFKIGAGGPIGGGKQYMALVSLEDAVGAIIFALDHEISGAFNVVTPQPATNADFTKALGKAVHRPAVVPMPGFAMRLILGAEQANEMILGGQRVLPRRLEAAGFTFQHSDVSAALASALA